MFVFMAVPPKRAEGGGGCGRFFGKLSIKKTTYYIKQTELIGEGVLLPNRSWFMFFTFPPPPPFRPIQYCSSMNSVAKIYIYINFFLESRGLETWGSRPRRTNFQCVTMKKIRVY